MKKVLFIFLVFFCSQIAMANENTSIYFNQILNSTSIPSDTEIRTIINPFNYSTEQKEEIFKETKKQFEDLYNNKDSKLMEQKAIEGVKLLQKGHLTPQDFMDIQK